MSEAELKKILENAAKYVLDVNHLDKLEQAARKHGRTFRSHQRVPRVTDKSSFLKNAVKHENN